ncbi:MAG: DUF4167 domain-containing protein [Rhizobiaceae bacterium]
MRGRGNRKGPNPLTRSYESNGPDVKIRGSAQQVADKYATLARDAQASGDPVMAENYLQHAEHYNRIIAAAQSQQQALRESREEQQQQQQADGEAADQADGDTNKSQQVSSEDGSGPQPVINGTPAEVALEETAVADGETGGGEKSAKAPRRPRRPRRDAAKPAKSETTESAPDEATAETSDGGDDEQKLAAAGS